MEWSDDEFEALLRQFRPLRPKALPMPRLALLAVAAAAAAAVIVAAVVIPLRFRSTSLAAPGSAQTPASTPSVTTDSGDGNQRQQREMRPAATPDRVPDAKPTPRDKDDREKSGAVVSDPPTLSPLAGVKALGPAPLKAPASAVIGADTRRVRVGGAVKPPTKVFDVRPEYPKGAQDAGIQGVVVLEIVIGEHGSVIEERVVDSIPELDQAAIDAVTQWRFEPTRLNGEPVEVEMNVMVNFTLR